MKSNLSRIQLFGRLLASIAPVAVMAACTVGPDYKRPDLTLPTEFRAQVTPADAASVADLPWWSVFGDKALQDLIGQGVANNYDLKIAVSRIEQARALLGVSESQSKPQVGYEAFAGGQRAIAPLAGHAGSVTYGTFGGLLNAAWELDVWGRIRRSNESAEANVLAQEDVRRGVLLTLVTDIAAGYFRLLELDRELEIAQESTQTFNKTFDLFNYRFKAGKDSELPVQRNQAALDESNARISDIKRLIAQQENALSVLVGSYPRDIVRGKGLIDQTMPQTPLGSTTDLLQRRPDILQAEQVMVGANAEIGVAVANFYPKIGLSAFLGGQATGVMDSFNGIGVWNILADVAGPIYSGGRLESIYHNRQAFWDESVSSYKKTVLVAFQETSDALAAQQNLAKQRQDLESQVAALRQSMDIALMRYDAGRASYFEVLEAEQQLFPAEDALAQTQRDQLLAVVSLYKALGGGWKLEPAQWASPNAAGR